MKCLFKKISLIHQLFCCFLFATIIPLLILSFQSLHCAHMALNDIQEKALQDQLKVGEQLIANWQKNNKPNEFENLFSLLSQPSNNFRWRVIDSKKQDLFDSGSGMPIALLPESLITGSKNLINFYCPTKGEMSGVSTKIEELNWLLLVETSDMRAISWMEKLKKRNFITLSLTLLIALVVVIYLSRSITAPFRRLVMTARKISAGDESERMPIKGVSESQDLANEFNAMLDSLTTLHLKLSQQMALAQIGELSSSVVHEMRNPLSSIRMNLQALAKKVADEKIYSELAQISLEQSNRLEYLLNELLRYGKTIILRRDRITCENLLKLIPKNQNISFQINPKIAELELLVDTEKMRQVFINLIENSLNACEKDSAKISVLCDKVSSGIEIKIRDNGPGIPQNILPEIFLPFVTGRSEGTGLGLANVKRFIELNGGSVRAANLAEKGAEFIIFLPTIAKDFS
ncbi:MAG: sensor histidine kinase [Lentisphaeria bacterium]